MTPSELARLHTIAKSYQTRRDEKLWHSGDLRWKLHDAQKTIYDRLRSLDVTTREAACLCSRRFGKSYLGCLLAIEDCIRKPGSYVRIIGPDIKQTTSIVVPLISKITQDAPPGLVRRTKSENKWLIGNSELILGGFDGTNIETHRGSESAAIYIEESGSSEPEAYKYAITDVLKPQLLHTRGKMVHLTTPPKVLGHYFVTETIAECRLNGTYFTFTIYDNPLLDEEQIASAVRDCGGETTVAFRREYMAELIRDETVLVVPEFDPAVHSKPLRPPDYAYWQTIIDVGGVRDKTACLLICYDWLMGKRYVYDERIYESNTPTSVIVAGCLEMEAQVKEHGPADGSDHVRWADAPGQLQVDMFDAHNFAVRLPLKDDWEASINSLKVNIAQDKWLIDPRCKMTIENLLSGTFNKQRTDFNRSAVLGHNDALAALMYGNRMIDVKRNPYPGRQIHRDSQFEMPVHSESQNVGKMLQPKRFGSFKK